VLRKRELAICVKSEGEMCQLAGQKANGIKGEAGKPYSEICETTQKPRMIGKRRALLAGAGPPLIGHKKIPVVRNNPAVCPSPPNRNGDRNESNLRKKIKIGRTPGAASARQQAEHTKSRVTKRKILKRAR